MAQVKMMRFFVAFSCMIATLSGSARAADNEPRTSDNSAASQRAVAAPEFEIFCDFRCPYCARMFVALASGAKYLKKRPDFIFHHYPFHKGSQKLARYYEATTLAAPALRSQIISSLYEFRAQTGTDDLDTFLRALSTVYGLNADRVIREMRSRDVVLAIRNSEREALARKVDSTPTIFFQGSLVTSQEPEALAAFILERSADDAPGSK